MRCSELLFLAACLLPATAGAQSFLNGDFEQNTVSGCTYNMTNTSFNLAVVGCVAYGTGGVTNGEIDVMDGPCVNYGPSGVVGACTLGLAAHNPNGVDALTLELSTPLVVGTSYTIHYWGFSPVLSFSAGAAQIELGTSATAGTPGTVIGVSPSFGAADFEHYSLTFTATAPDSHISVSAVMQSATTWAWIDGFSIQPAQVAYCDEANGNGINPSVFTCVTPPQLGGSWVLDVAFASNTVLSAAYASTQRMDPLDLGFGELLIAAPVVSLPGFGVHVASIPATPTLMGFPLFSQGLRVNTGPAGLALELTNSQVGVIGL